MIVILLMIREVISLAISAEILISIGKDLALCTWNVKTKVHYHDDDGDGGDDHYDEESFWMILMAMLMLMLMLMNR